MPRRRPPRDVDRDLRFEDFDEDPRPDAWSTVLAIILMAAGAYAVGRALWAVLGG